MMPRRDPPLHPGHDAGIDYELVIADNGTATLTCGGEVMWTSDADDEYAESFDNEFIDITDDAQVDDLCDWLEEHGYVPPQVDVAIVRGEESLDDHPEL
jgi:hypothetical protein